jgi:hypothetical protein
MPQEAGQQPQEQQFTPEELARYERWGLGVKNDGEPAVTTTTEDPAPQDPPADAGADEVLHEDEELHEEGEEGAGDGTQPPKKKSGVQRLKEKLQVEREARIRAEERAKILEETRKPADPVQTPPAPPVPAAPKPKPQPGDFDTNAEYIDALTDWKIEEREKARETATKAEQAKTEAQTKQTTWNERLAAAKTRYPDFDQALKTPFPMSPAMREAMLESELGPDLGYYLVKHQEEAQRIAAMTPAAAALALGTIQAKLTPASTPQTTQTPPRTTQAPPPPTPVGGRPIPAVDTTKLSDEEWLQYHRKQRTGR